MWGGCLWMVCVPMVFTSLHGYCIYLFIGFIDICFSMSTYYLFTVVVMVTGCVDSGTSGRVSLTASLVFVLVRRRFDCSEVKHMCHTSHPLCAHENAIRHIRYMHTKVSYVTSVITFHGVVLRYVVCRHVVMLSWWQCSVQTTITYKHMTPQTHMTLKTWYIKHVTLKHVIHEARDTSNTWHFKHVTLKHVTRQTSDLGARNKLKEKKRLFRILIKRKRCINIIIIKKVA